MVEEDGRKEDEVKVKALSTESSPHDAVQEKGQVRANI